MREEGKPQGEGTSKKSQKGSQVRNEGALRVALQGRLCNTRVGVWWSNDFTESRKTSLFTPQGRMEIALFRPATLTLAYGMPSAMNRGAEPLESHSRTHGLLGGSSLLHLLAFTSCYFFSSHSQVKLTKVPAPAHVYPGPVPLFLSFANPDVK